MRYALLAARPDAVFTAAFDINPNACEVYEHNFGDRVTRKNLASVPHSALDALGATLWLMSPPCQPFTRQGAVKDLRDGRAESFLRLVDALGALENPPTDVLVENVVGFETSEMRGVMLDAFDDAGFATEEFVLTPRQFGVPYSRPRYFCLATKAERRAAAGDARAAETTKPRAWPLDRVRRAPPPSPLSDPARWVPGAGAADLAPCVPREVAPRKPRRPGETHLEEAKRRAAAEARGREEETRGDLLYDALGNETAERGRSVPAEYSADASVCRVATLAHFLEDGGVRSDGGGIGSDGGIGSSGRPDLFATHGVPRAEVLKAMRSVDVRSSSDRKCNCFTKSYGKYVKGTGSFVGDRGGGPISKGTWEAAYERGGGGGGGERGFPSPPGPGPGGVSAIRLRYFTEREVANVHSFPASFAFPETTTRAQRYALLGNSLSVACVAPLLDYLLTRAGGF